MKILIMILSLTLIGCGKEVKPVEGETPVEAPIIIADTTPKLYIIGGQSNAVYLLESTRDAPRYGIFEASNPVNNVVGYAYGNTNISFWLDSYNNNPLIEKIKNYCDLNPYLIWWQGESDILEGTIGSYEDKLQQLYVLFKNQCPSLKIITIVLQDYKKDSYGVELEKLRDIQRRNGDFHISAEGYDLGDTIHLTESSDKLFWGDIISKFPLGVN